MFFKILFYFCLVITIMFIMDIIYYYKNTRELFFVQNAEIIDISNTIIDTISSISGDISYMQSDLSNIETYLDVSFT